MSHRTRLVGLILCIALMVFFAAMAVRQWIENM